MTRRSAWVFAIWLVSVLLPATVCMLNEFVSLLVNGAVFVKDFSFWPWALPVSLLVALAGGWTAVLLSHHSLPMRVSALVATPVVILAECAAISALGFWLFGLPLD